MTSFSLFTAEIFAFVSSSTACKLILFCSICLKLHKKPQQKPVKGNLRMMYKLRETQGDQVWFGRRYLSCFVLIFCSRFLFLPLTSDSCFFFARRSLSRRLRIVSSSRMALIRSSIILTRSSAACGQGVKGILFKYLAC